MAVILAADIGGTKTLLELTHASGELICEYEFDSQAYASFDLILEDLFNQKELHNRTVDIACFAVAGPVEGQTASVTNLPWQLDAEVLLERFAINKIILCNDFEAVAHGIPSLDDSELVTLQQGDKLEFSPKAVIGAGTGLGQALLLPEDNAWRVVATEGGHVNFAPTNSVQILLLEHLLERFSHASYEQLLSGSGLVIIYEFLRAYRQYDEPVELRQIMIDSDPAAAISLFAQQHNDPLSSEALALFIQIYGAQAGNLALNVLPRAGLYLAGGIAAKNVEQFKKPGFIDSFIAKGKMKHLVEKMPVYLILQPKVGLIGARTLAQQAI